MKKNDEAPLGTAFFATSLLLHSVTGITISLVISLLGSLLVLTEVLPPDFIAYFARFAVLVGAFTASILSCKKLGKPILTALIQGVMSALLLLLIGALLYGRVLPKQFFIGTVGLTFIGSVLGAMFSAIKKSRKTKKRK